jgi:hypothetical protein
MADGGKGIVSPSVQKYLTIHVFVLLVPGATSLYASHSEKIVLRSKTHPHHEQQT